ncbi:MAG TPA: glycosyltransferase family 39 protein [Bacteroidota bacterium]|nr:glycosyltransferase family 39 protein [Bacteroidota bacterium]
MSAAVRRIYSHEGIRILSAIFIGAVLIFSKLGGDGIANYDDAFYAQKAKEIWQTGSWMTLHYAGAPAFENPPGFIWLVALSYKIFGVNDFGAIFPSALFGVLTMVLVYFFGRSLFGAGTAPVAAFVMATTLYFIKYARHAMIDVTLSFFVTAALLAAWTAARSGRRYFLAWGTAVAVCVLMKSVLGFFPALITVVFLVLTGRRRLLVDPWFLGGSAIALVLGCSWYLHEYLAFGEAFTNLHFRWLILQRGFESGQGPWYGHLDYLGDILKNYWPWLPALAWGVVTLWSEARKGDDRAVLLLLWVSSFVIVMSMMQMRSSWYIMPVYPAAALICGRVIGGRISERFRERALIFVAATGVLAAVAVNAAPVRLSSEREKDVRTLAPAVSAYGRSGAKIVGYRFDYHSVNNALLFYSDYAAQPVYDRRDELFGALESPGATVCILYTRDVEGLGPLPAGYGVVAGTTGLSLIANRPAAGPAGPSH